MGRFQATIILRFVSLIRCSLKYSVPTEKCADVRDGGDFTGDHTCVSSAHSTRQNAASPTGLRLPLPLTFKFL